MFNIFTNRPLFVEEYIPGTEYTVFVLGNKDGTLRSFSTYKSMIDYS